MTKLLLELEDFVLYKNNYGQYELFNPEKDLITTHDCLKAALINLCIEFTLGIAKLHRPNIKGIELLENTSSCYQESELDCKQCYAFDECSVLEPTGGLNVIKP